MAERKHLNDAEFEAGLARMRPRSSQLSRDHVMYLAGRASLENTSRRRWLRTSATAAGWLLAVGFCALWLRQPEPVVVTKVEYIERVVEPTADAPPPSIATASPAGHEHVEQAALPTRVQRHGHDGDLDELLASALNRTGHGAGSGVPETGVRDANVTSGSRWSDSYIDLRKAYLQSPRTRPYTKEQL